jgi:hypothetical protein
VKIFVTLFSYRASYTLTIARNLAAIVTEWLAVLWLGKAGTAGLSLFSWHGPDSMPSRT